MTRLARAVVVSILCGVMATAVTGCGATNAVVGIHEPPKATATSVPLTADRAERILGRALTAAYLGETKKGAAAGEQLRTAYMAEGLRGARGRVKLARVQPEVTISPLQAPHPKLLAVSRGLGFPRFIVAQTVASEGGLPVLHLLVSPDAATPYRISMSVEMVPAAAVKPFDPLSKGAPSATNGQGLAVAPETLLKRYATHMAFPTKTVSKPPFVEDSYSGQVRAGAAAVAKSVEIQATFAQVHKVVPRSVYAVRQASGDALVFGVLERKDSFTVKPSQSVNTAGNKAFVLLTDEKAVSEKASITTLEFVVFAVPRSTGKARLVAAREQIVAGSGS